MSFTDGAGRTVLSEIENASAAPCTGAWRAKLTP